MRMFTMYGFYIRDEEEEGEKDISFCLGNLRTRIIRYGIVVDLGLRALNRDESGVGWEDIFSPHSVAACKIKDWIVRALKCKR
jgi:hypothetical protein